MDHTAIDVLSIIARTLHKIWIEIDYVPFRWHARLSLSMFITMHATLPGDLIFSINVRMNNICKIFWSHMPSSTYIAKVTAVWGM